MFCFLSSDATDFGRNDNTTILFHPLANPQRGGAVDLCDFAQPPDGGLLLGAPTKPARCVNIPPRLGGSGGLLGVLFRRLVMFTLAPSLAILGVPSCGRHCGGCWICVVEDGDSSNLHGGTPTVTPLVHNQRSGPAALQLIGFPLCTSTAAATSI